MRTRTWFLNLDLRYGRDGIEEIYGERTGEGKRRNTNVPRHSTYPRYISQAISYHRISSTESHPYLHLTPHTNSTLFGFGRNGYIHKTSHRRQPQPPPPNNRQNGEREGRDRRSVRAFVPRNRFPPKKSPGTLKSGCRQSQIPPTHNQEFLFHWPLHGERKNTPEYHALRTSKPDDCTCGARSCWRR
jgi:hypothetical protein